MNAKLQHSADVYMYLLIDGEQIEVAGCLGTRVTLREPRKIAPSTNAEFVITVDGESRRCAVSIPFGTAQSNASFQIAYLTSAKDQLATSTTCA